MNTTTPSLYWFDYETFGTHPAWDRPCQFAGVRTDLDLNEIDDPMVIYCQQSMDYLPHPAACRVTGLLPQDVNAQGLRENEFIAKIVEQIGAPGTCSLGYNSIRFDDEFTRNTLFRNFHDAYEHEYKDGNSRWDLLDVVRLTRALRPDGIQWPVHDDGTPSNRLEHLTQANHIEHGHAHDALSDVRATISVARLIRNAHPKLYDYAFTHRQKHAVADLLKVKNPAICLQISGMIPGAKSHIAAVLPIAMHRDNRNSIIVLDLQEDPSRLLAMSSDEINESVFTKKNTSPDIALNANKASACRPGLRTIQINKCPVVVPWKTLRENDAKRLGIDTALIEHHAHIARQLLEQEHQQKISDAMSRSWPDERIDAEGSLYSGSFLSQADRERSEALRHAEPSLLSAYQDHFEDKRLSVLAWRYQARHYPEMLDQEQLAQWREYCREKLQNNAAPWLSFEGFEQAMADQVWDAEEYALRDALSAHKDAVQAFSSDVKG